MHRYSTSNIERQLLVVLAFEYPCIELSIECAKSQLEEFYAWNDEAKVFSKQEIQPYSYSFIVAANRWDILKLI